ncbi:MAG TPA: hypothetical protein V6C58_27985 [Allocoleopsis sp.]
MPEQDMQNSQGQMGQDQGMQQGQMQESSNTEEGQAGEFMQINAMVSDLDRRLRVLEERYSTLRKKMQLTDQNLIESEKAFHKDIRLFNDESLELKRSISDFEEKVAIFGNEMTNTAKKTELKVIEKYLALWNPTLFVTRNELREHLRNNSLKVKNNEDDE